MEKGKKRDTRITVDLLGYKQPWIDWCKAQGHEPAHAFRQIVARLTAGGTAAASTPAEVEPHQPERTTKRKEVALTPSELERVEAIAQAEGYSVSRWLAALVRARLTSTPQFGQHELELLARSNLQLLKIGRNLNQVAKALNTSPHDHRAYRVELIEELEALIKAHTVSVSDAMTANIKRWRIK